MDKIPIIDKKERKECRASMHAFKILLKQYNERQREQKRIKKFQNEENKMQMNFKKW